MIHLSDPNTSTWKTLTRACWERGKVNKDVLKPQQQGLPQLPHPILRRGPTQGLLEQSPSSSLTENTLTQLLSCVCLHSRIPDEALPEPSRWVPS